METSAFKVAYPRPAAETLSRAWSMHFVFARSGKILDGVIGEAVLTRVVGAGVAIPRVRGDTSTGDRSPSQNCRAFHFCIM